MLTPNQLKKEIGASHRYDSITYNENRTILKYLDKPVIAYGIGYMGFICIIKTDRRRIKGYRYINANSFPGYTNVDFEVALKEIKTNPYLVKKEIDEEKEHSWTNKKVKIRFKDVNVSKEIIKEAKAQQLVEDI